MAGFEAIDQQLAEIRGEGRPYAVQKAKPGKFLFGRRKVREYGKGVARDTWFQVKLNDELHGKKLTDLWKELPEMFDKVCSNTVYGMYTILLCCLFSTIYQELLFSVSRSWMKSLQVPLIS